ncbi:MAG: hypothetical protein ACK4WH_06480 [Phycisphaerales bacterium]
MIDVRGWPMGALWCGYTIEVNEKIRVYAAVRGGIEVPGLRRKKGAWSGDYPAALPLRPVWAGLVVNSVPTAGALAAMVYVPGRCGGGSVGELGRARCAVTTCARRRRGGRVRSVGRGSAAKPAGTVRESADSAPPGFYVYSVGYDGTKYSVELVHGKSAKQNPPANNPSE